MCSFHCLMATFAYMENMAYMVIHVDLFLYLSLSHHTVELLGLHHVHITVLLSGLLN